MADTGVINEKHQELLDGFLTSLLVSDGSSMNTVNSYRFDLIHFFKWVDANKMRINAMQEQDIQSYVSLRAKKTSPRTAARSLSTLKKFWFYLILELEYNSNPTANLESPSITQKIPTSVSESQVTELLNAPDINTDIGCRDKAMLEVLYATGMRVSELINLRFEQVNLNVGVCYVVGKGGKERLIPLGEDAVSSIRIYLKKRSLLFEFNKSREIFLTRRGSKMTRQYFWLLIQKYADAISLKIKISPHTLRHAFATHLLNHGADLRSVQMLLGHSNLSTTQIYTFVAINRLKKIHEQHHPRG